MKWFKKKVKEESEVEKFSRQFTARDYPPPTPKHLIPIKHLVNEAEAAHNNGYYEVEKDLLKAAMNHIERHLTNTTD